MNKIEKKEDERKETGGDKPLLTKLQNGYEHSEMSMNVCGERPLRQSKAICSRVDAIFC